MQKRLLKAFICTTAVLTTIGLTMVGAAHSSNSRVNEVNLVEKETNTAAMTAEAKIVVSTETQIETDNKAASEESIEVTTSDSKLTQASEPERKSETHTTTTKQQENKNALYSASQFRNLGVIQWNGWKWTWYSERVLPGGGLSIPGRHNDADGYVCDENGYLCLSSSSLSKGSIIDTPLGKQGKVYDTGCDSNVIDVYVNW